MNVLTKVSNPLLHRIEALVELEHASNPGIVQATKLVSEAFKVSEEVVVVKALRSRYGRSSFLIEAFVYSSPEMRAQVEPKVKEKKAVAS